MKRIDEKIKEIEQKDKTNRWVYYIIVALLAAFLIYASTTRKKINLQADQIDELTIKATQTYKELAKSDSINKKLYDDLVNSLQPEEYWNYIKSENSNEAYIAYLTNDWGIDKEKYIPTALENLKSTATVGFEGWLFVGSKNNAGNYENKDVIDIIYRPNFDGNASALKNLEPKVGDIVKLKTTSNRKTYQYKSLSGTNEQGWRNKTKAFITEVYQDPNSTNFNIKIKYY
jgi:hypothetical protein